MIEFDTESFNDFIQMLYTKQDIGYKAFNDKIVKSVDESIGIRMPILRNIAKQISQSKHTSDMLALLHQQSLFEIRMIEGLLIGLIKMDKETLQNNTAAFVETRINNWALCDSFVIRLKTQVKQNKTWFYEKAKFYAHSDKVWEVRFGLVMFLCYFEEKACFIEIKEIILTLNNQEYYAKMAAAWLISALYNEMKDEIVVLLKNPQINSWIRNKAIQKIKESYRVSVDDKNALIALKLELK